MNHCNHVDFVKLKLYKVLISDLKWDVFKPHPVLNNHFTLKDDLPNYHSKNFDIYVDNGNNVTVKASIPYLLFGHNYIGSESYDLKEVFCDIQQITGLNIMGSRVLTFEYGQFRAIDIDATCYIENIVGVKDYYLQKSTPYMKMFGNNQLSLKIYDAVANAKAKKTYSKGMFPKSRLIKHELKIVAPERLFGKCVYAVDLTKKEFIKCLDSLLKEHLDSLIIQGGFRHRPIDTTINHILFATLKNVEQEFGASAFKRIAAVLESMALTPSQKSKRKKSLLALETTYNAQLEKR